MSSPQPAPVDPHATFALVSDATDRLVRTASSLTPERLAAPSLLPGWTRGHVLSHVSRNADALIRAMGGAREHRQVDMYDSDEARERDIEAGAARPPSEQVADLRASADRFAEAVHAMPEDAWSFVVRHRKGFEFPASRMVWMRLVELEYHHVDLEAGYTPGHWPDEFVRYEVDRLAARFSGEEAVPATLVRDTVTGVEHRIGAEGTPRLTVEGPGAALVAWLSGRAGADGLTVHRDGTRIADPRSEVPSLPPMS